MNKEEVFEEIKKIKVTQKEIANVRAIVNEELQSLQERRNEILDIAIHKKEEIQLILTQKQLREDLEYLNNLEALIIYKRNLKIRINLKNKKRGKTNSNERRKSVIRNITRDNNG